MTKNIAIMTWYKFNNYGTIWQAFALRESIIKMGYEKVDLIDYKSKEVYTPIYKKFKLKYIERKVLYGKATVRQGKEKKAKMFDDFRKNNYTYTKECVTKTDLHKLNAEYDKFVCGSDQIWSPNFFDENFFLEFADSSSKKIAYAPSIGLNGIENSVIREKMTKLISDFEDLSIREEKGAEIIKKLCRKEAQVVLDPTLLFDKKEWNKRYDLENFNEKDYILVYSLEKREAAKKLAKKFEKKLGKKVIIIATNTQFSDYLEKNHYNASPIEFLKLIYNASLVITDSFHGTIFSANFNVPFVTLKRFKDDYIKSQNSRIHSILKIINAEDRFYNDNFEYFIKNMNMNFEMVNEKLEKKRQESKKFLETALSKENKMVEVRGITSVCTGCGVCASACPQKCIEIKMNDAGFFEYAIDESKCINCGLCRKVCAQVNSEKKKIEEMNLYSAQSKEKNILKKSSSGGIAYEISKLGIEEGYEIIGCTYDYEMQKAKHIKINSLKDIELLSGSKYVQSYTKEAFDEIKKMNKGIIIGTPCQIASVDNYLKIMKKRSDFILVELICFGIPSYLMWNRFLNTTKEEIKSVTFRDKSVGWHNKALSINNKKVYRDKDCLFYDFFNVGNVYNTACYECNYRTHSCADIKIGDFWGKKFEKNKEGVSMIITCTSQGEEFIKKLEGMDRISLNKEDVTDYFRWQRVKNIAKPIEYDEIIKELKDERNALKDISKKYCKPYLKYRKMRKLLQYIHKMICFYE